MSQTDEQLLDAIAVLYAALDPAPDDLADGVLARLAIEDLESEYELLTLIERVDHAAGTRGTDVIAPGDTGTVALEFAGTSYRVLVRHQHRRRPSAASTAGSSRAVPLRVFLGPHGADASRRPPVAPTPTRDGRFEFTVTGDRTGAALAAAAGHRRVRGGVAPFVTPAVPDLRAARKFSVRPCIRTALTAPDSSEAGLLIRGNSKPDPHEGPRHGAAGRGAPGGCAEAGPVAGSRFRAADGNQRQPRDV